MTPDYLEKSHFPQKEKKACLKDKKVIFKLV